MRQPTNVRPREDGLAVVIQDQTALPARTVFLELETEEQMYDAIFELKVRGAPAIGICAAYCYAVLASKLPEGGYDDFLAETRRFKAYLDSARPTAVNLSWALNRMEKLVLANSGTPVAQIKKLLRDEAARLQQEDMRVCAAIARHGLTLLNLKKGVGVLTHCNAGPLATSVYGTALGPILLAREQGVNIRVFADETRPLLQGARLTSYELDQAGVDVTLICDSMASIVMKNGWVDVCFVGCDRVAKNGDTANKIGTSGLAILAKHYGIPFYVLGPTSTIDFACETGEDIEIELRDPDEIKKKFYTEPMAPDTVKCYNPAFDVTDHTLISGIVTEHGILRPPYTQSMETLRAKLGL